MAGEKLKLKTPLNAEIAFLIREKFTDEDMREMGLESITVMHEPIKDWSDTPLLLNSSRKDNGNWFYASLSRSDIKWDEQDGFAFMVS